MDSKSTTNETCPKIGAYHLINVDTGELVPLPCNTYSCDVCGPRKARKLKIHIQRQFECYDYIRMFTFNFRTTIFQNPKHCYLKAGEIWRRFINNIRRDRSLSKQLRNFQYCKILEFTKRGYVHYHVLSTEYMPRHILQKHWQNAINTVMKQSGWNGSVNTVGTRTSKYAAWYVSKYVLKTAREIGKRLIEWFGYIKRRYKVYSKSGELKLFYPRSPIHKWIFETVYEYWKDAPLTCHPHSQLPEKDRLLWQNLPPPLEISNIDSHIPEEWKDPTHRIPEIYNEPVF